MRALAQSHAPMAIGVLARIATKGKNESARALAANSLLDRGFGKPTQPISGDADAPPLAHDVMHRLDSETVKMLEAVIFGERK